MVSPKTEINTATMDALERLAEPSEISEVVFLYFQVDPHF
jgi:hypothetical protein